ncbi:hypothetical protein [Burkholderia mayonis]|uniref:hypothetical protein n=1 Tax=Burkholderia mayonis TaxID=1385591 RepID=UPI00131ED265|nr:hypothetical protein [Burkholderia mayonis]
MIRSLAEMSTNYLQQSRAVLFEPDLGTISSNCRPCERIRLTTGWHRRNAGAHDEWRRSGLAAFTRLCGGMARARLMTNVPPARGLGGN